MRVDIILLHVSVLGNSRDKEPERNCDKNPLPHSAVDIVPHLVVEHVDLLEALDVVLLAWSISESPDSEVVHVSHVCPGMFKSWSLFQQFVFESGLLQVSCGSQELRGALSSALHIAKFVHY
jgi:hypothetical protein